MRFLFLAIILLLPLAAQAEKTVPFASSNCAMQETATINVNFNSTETDLNTIQSKFDAKKNEIYALSKQAGVEKLSLTSMNYSVSPQGYGTQYSVSGNLSFTVVPTQKATPFLVLLTQKSFMPSLNISAYNSNGTGCAIDLNAIK